MTTMNSDSCRAVFPQTCEGGYQLIFVDDDGNHLTFEEAQSSLYPDLHEDFRGPFADAGGANAATDDFVSQTQGCGYFPDASGSPTLIREDADDPSETRRNREE